MTRSRLLTDIHKFHMPPRLPPELWDIIIRNLNVDVSDDKATLRACSLTCRAFLPASRYRLFYRVRLRVERAAKRFLKNICSGIPSSTNPIPFIRHLEMRGRHRWVIDVLVFLATRLLEVTYLQLRELKWSLLDENARTTLLSGFQKVTRLEFSGEFHTSDEMTQFISLFPSLTIISCAKTWWTINEMIAPPPTTTPLPCGLATIIMGSSHSMYFNRLLRLQSHPNVRDLRIDIRSRHARSTAILLKTLGASLDNLSMGLEYSENRFVFYFFFSSQFLSLTFRSTNNSAGVLENINLAHNTNLRSIELDYGAIYLYPLRQMLTLVNQVIPLHLEHITMRVYAIMNSHCVNWSQVEDLFTSNQWPHLRRLTIVLYGPQTTSGTIRAIRAHLPILDVLGFLEVTSGLL